MAALLQFESWFGVCIRYAVALFELMGAFIIVSSTISAFYKYLRHVKRARLQLEKGLAAGLQFMLAGEILRTLISHEWHELGIVGAIILLRTALNLLIHWEIVHLQHDSEDE